MTTNVAAQELQKHIDERESRKQILDYELASLRQALGIVVNTPTESVPSPTVPEDVSIAEPATPSLVDCSATPFPDHRWRPGSFSETVAQAIYDVLEERGPLSRKRILQEVQARGIYLGAKDPGNTISHYLTLDPRFVRTVPPGRWQLAERPTQTASQE